MIIGDFYQKHNDVKRQNMKKGETKMQTKGTIKSTKTKLFSLKVIKSKHRSFVSKYNSMSVTWSVHIKLFITKTLESVTMSTYPVRSKTADQ